MRSIKYYCSINKNCCDGVCWALQELSKYNIPVQQLSEEEAINYGINLVPTIVLLKNNILIKQINGKFQHNEIEIELKKIKWI